MVCFFFFAFSQKKNTHTQQKQSTNKKKWPFAFIYGTDIAATVSFGVEGGLDLIFFCIHWTICSSNSLAYLSGDVNSETFFELSWDNTKHSVAVNVTTNFDAPNPNIQIACDGGIMEEILSLFVNIQDLVKSAIEKAINQENTKMQEMFDTSTVISPYQGVQITYDVSSFVTQANQYVRLNINGTLQANPGLY